MHEHGLGHALVAWIFAFKSQRGFGVRDDLFEAERLLVHACSLGYSVSLIRFECSSHSVYLRTCKYAIVALIGASTQLATPAL